VTVATVFVPGLLCSPRLYEPVLSAAWAHGPVTVADTRHDRTISDMASRLLSGAPRQFAVVGLSMGGYVALEVLRQAPDRVLAAALMSTSARPDTPEQRAARSGQVAAVRAGGFEELVAAAFPAVVGADSEHDAALRERWSAMADDVGPRAFERQQQATGGRIDQRPLLASVTCPTLVLHGTGDRLIPVEHGRELASGIPGARLELLDGCGHSPTWERPVESAAALAGLLRNAASTSD
jgi:pimeloyl-ACP methyl ester carboxylesterase